MSVNLGLAQVSGDFLIAALVIYSLAVLAFAGDFAFGRPRRAAARAAGLDAAADRAVELAAVGAPSAAVGEGAAVAEGAGGTGAAGEGDFAGGADMAVQGSNNEQSHLGFSDLELSRNI